MCNVVDRVCSIKRVCSVVVVVVVVVASCFTFNVYDVFKKSDQLQQLRIR